MANSAAKDNRLTLEVMQADRLSDWAAAFLLDCRTRNLSPKTVEFYRWCLTGFVTFAEEQAAPRVLDITPALVRLWLDALEGRGRNPGGRHAEYRALRAFLRWWERETEPEHWTNPIGKVKPPKLPTEPLKPVTAETIAAMLAICQADDFAGIRDKALLLCLADTGARAAEFMALTLGDVNAMTGQVIIKSGKGRKPRTVFIGQKARRSLRVYLKKRADHCPALWVTAQGQPLALASLRQVLIRRGRAAGVTIPSPHAFRRFFALAMLRAGVDLVSIARLMGHSDLETLRRYLAQEAQDLQDAHARGSPVDKNL
jgi:site-specific recombinase XerD